MLNLWERAFFIGEHTQATYRTYLETVQILENSAGLQYPELRSEESLLRYKSAFEENREQELREIKTKLGNGPIALFVKKFPYTAISTVADESVLHAVVWWSLEDRKKPSEQDIANRVKEIYGNAVCAWVMQHLDRNITVREMGNAHVFVDVATYQ